MESMYLKINTSYILQVFLLLYSVFVLDKFILITYVNSYLSDRFCVRFHARDLSCSCCIIIVLSLMKSYLIDSC